jgi:hypothetical protein
MTPRQGRGVVRIAGEEHDCTAAAVDTAGTTGRYMQTRAVDRDKAAGRNKGSVGRGSAEQDTGSGIRRRRRRRRPAAFLGEQEG